MFGLKGACLSIDTACSSSLVGAHYGARDTAAGDCARALTAGVNLTLSPGKTSAFAITGTPEQHGCTITPSPDVGARTVVLHTDTSLSDNSSLQDSKLTGMKAVMLHNVLPAYHKLQLHCSSQ